MQTSQSVDEILESRRGGDLYRHLIEKFASFSGVSGVQPKVLIRDQASSEMMGERRSSTSYRGATHIVKFWEPNEFPQLAANEYFCLRAAEHCGLQVPRYRLAVDGVALVIDRFDLRSDGSYRGFEDCCVLNGKRTEDKYAGSYETSVMKRFNQFSESTEVARELENLFTLIVLNCMIRNGDAHLKNFGIIYDDVLGDAHLAPVYDLVTTTAYLARDRMALTLNGTTAWPNRAALARLGETRTMGSPGRIREILERVADSLAPVSKELEQYLREHPEFREIGGRMLEQWDLGRQGSLST